MDTSTTIYDHESDSHAIPIPAVQEAIEQMGYASHERVMFQMLYYTGCRIQELDRMRMSRIYGDWLYWECGKNQKGWRKERLPIAYLEELREYRDTHRVLADHLFGISGETFRGYFKHDIRRTLGSGWLKQRPVFLKDGVRAEYVYQLKSLRKNYQTLHFKKELDKWGDPGIAIEMTGRKMRYSTARISARHYVENFDVLGVNALSNLDPARLLTTVRQRRLTDFGVE